MYLAKLLASYVTRILICVYIYISQFLAQTLAYLLVYSQAKVLTYDRARVMQRTWQIVRHTVWPILLHMFGVYYIWQDKMEETKVR